MVRVKRRAVGRGGHDLGATEIVGIYESRVAAAEAIRGMIRQFDVFGPDATEGDDPGNEGNYWFARRTGEFVALRFWIEEDGPLVGGRTSW